MIVFFAYKKKFLSYAHLLLRKSRFKYVILTKFNKYYFDKACAIIPLGIGSQCRLGNVPREYNHKFLVCAESTYDMLDDKNKFYDFVKKHHILDNSKIRLIPTYGPTCECANKYGNFIIKKCNGAGSSSNKVIDGYVHNLIREYSDRYQIQDVIDVGYVYSVNCLAHCGKLISALNFIIKGFIEHDFYNKNKRVHVQHVPREFRDVIERIVDESGYNGIFEVEFIVDTNGIPYLMECNPRVSSNMKCMDVGGIIPYTEYIIKPYHNIIHGKPAKVPDLYVEKSEVTYYGKMKCPDYSEDGNVIRF